MVAGGVESNKAGETNIDSSHNTAQSRRSGTVGLQNCIYLARCYHTLKLNMRLLHACCTQATGNEVVCYTSCVRDWILFHRPPPSLPYSRQDTFALVLDVYLVLHVSRFN